MPSNTDANPNHSGLKKVRVGFHVAGYTLTTLGRKLADKLSGGYYSKGVQKLHDYVKGYTRVPTNQNITLNIAGEDKQFPATFLGSKLPPGKNLETLRLEMQDKINAGEKLLMQIDAGTAVTPCTQKNMTDLMCYLQAQSQSVTGHYVEGSMHIPDPGNRIKDFLDTNPESYQRKSSHIDEFQNDPNAVGTHRGIDAYGRTRNPDEMLPNSRKTVMYGTMEQSNNLKMGENRLWLKMEPHGAWAFSPRVNDPNGPKRSANSHDGKAAVGHSFSFLETQGQGSLAGSRKERIPDDIKDEWKAIQRLARQELANQNPSQAVSNMVRDGEGLQTARGVRFLNDYSEQLKDNQQLSQGLRDRITTFQGDLQQRYPDDIDMRVGNESILKRNHLIRRDIDDIPGPQVGQQVQQQVGNNRNSRTL
ncbi:hypothetical protein [Roseimicrobium sp. ORNL1]|uniref:hypothetical protein n=1 Tax=Roseimicrobium sp. ORNL1 TaxID=2711231 RepID=UPI0013E148A8|nr:hypothetical protein [Roseimicrobium sp. ORNL1]QIF05848.1 hypothetical protein G5S37_31610 [Roseimicrobium sp. ORNL1]